MQMSLIGSKKFDVRHLPQKLTLKADGVLDSKILVLIEARLADGTLYDVLLQQASQQIIPPDDPAVSG